MKRDTRKYRVWNVLSRGVGGVMANKCLYEINKIYFSCLFLSILCGTTLACDWLRSMQNVSLFNCENKTIAAGHYFSQCLKECFHRKEECQAITLPSTEVKGATWCCLHHSPDVVVAQGDGYLLYDPEVTVHQACEDNTVMPCAGNH